MIGHFGLAYKKVVNERNQAKKQAVSISFGGGGVGKTFVS